MQKFEYKFVKIELELVDAQSLRTTTDYREAIQEHAAEGWRFVHVFCPNLTVYGRPIHYELIFERAVPDSI